MKIYGMSRRDMRTCAWGCCTLNKSPNAAVGASAICGGQHRMAKRSGRALVRRGRKIARRDGKLACAAVE
jgi:hypothetical protein